MFRISYSPAPASSTPVYTAAFRLVSLFSPRLGLSRMLQYHCYTLYRRSRLVPAPGLVVLGLG